MTDLLATAVELHEAGRCDEASVLYRRLLADNPDHADALHLLGVVRHQQGDHVEALELIRRAIARNPRNAAYHSNAALAMRALNRRDEALVALRESLRIDPSYAAAYRNLATVLSELGRRDEALATLRQFTQAVPLEPTAWKQLGVQLSAARQFDEAREALEKARQLRPQDAEIELQLGLAWKATGQPAEAERHLRRAFELAPQRPEMSNQLGILLIEQKGRTAEAADCFRATLRLDPAHRDARHNLAVAERDLGQVEESRRLLEELLAVAPDNVEGHNNLGIACQFLGRWNEALEAYERTLRLAPDHVWAHFNRSQVLLQLERWHEGWLEYEWRWKRPGLGLRQYACPRWDGRPNPSATLLVWAEQGLGDTFQFVRFLEAARRHVGRLVFECQAPLEPLLRQIAAADELVPRGRPLPRCDFQAPLMSLPGLLGIPAEQFASSSPYLQPDAALVERWRERLASVPQRLKIGVAWQGNKLYARDRLRSVPLAAFAALARRPDVALVSLQKGEGREQLTALAEQAPVYDWTDEMDGPAGAFMDTAALARCLDLIVTSDSAVAHLAGAIGAPTWLATAFSPDWRWGVAGDRSPWYPSMRLFRQSSVGDWDGPFDAMAAALP